MKVDVENTSVCPLMKVDVENTSVCPLMKVDVENTYVCPLMKVDVENTSGMMFTLNKPGIPSAKKTSLRMHIQQIVQYIYSMIYGHTDEKNYFYLLE